MFKALNLTSIFIILPFNTVGFIYTKFYTLPRFTRDRNSIWNYCFVFDLPFDCDKSCDVCWILITDLDGCDWVFNHSVFLCVVVAAFGKRG